MILLTNFFNS